MLSRNGRGSTPYSKRKSSFSNSPSNHEDTTSDSGTFWDLLPNLSGLKPTYNQQRFTPNITTPSLFNSTVNTSQSVSHHHINRNHSLQGRNTLEQSLPYEEMIFHEQQPQALSTVAVTDKSFSCELLHINRNGCLTSQNTLRAKMLSRNGSTPYNKRKLLFSNSPLNPEDTHSDSGSFQDILPHPSGLTKTYNQQRFTQNITAPSLFNTSRCVSHHHISGSHNLQGKNASALVDSDEDDGLFGVKEVISTKRLLPKHNETNSRRKTVGKIKCTKLKEAVDDQTGYKQSLPYEEMIFHEHQPKVLSTVAITDKSFSCGLLCINSNGCLTSQNTIRTTFLVLVGNLTVTQNRKTYEVNAGAFIYIPPGIPYSLKNNGDEEVQLSYFKCDGK